MTIAALLIAAAPASAAPLGAWPLDEGAGQIAHDVSGNGHHGRLGASPGADGSDPTWVAGRFGSALRFVGEQDQFVSLAAPAGLGPATVTVEAWVRRLGSPGGWRYVVSNGAVACEFASYGLYTGPDGGLSFYISDATHFVRTPELGPNAIWDGNWHHAVGTYDGRQVRLFVDGVEVAAAPTGFSIFYGAPEAYIGTYRGSCERPFTGDIDEVRISSGARSEDRIVQDAERDRTTPLPPQAPPVNGPPAGGAPRAARCVSIKATPKRVVEGRRTKIRMTVRRAGKPLVGRRIAVRATGVKRSVRTRRGGRATVYVRVKQSSRLTKKGRRSIKKSRRLTLRASGQPSRCAKALAVKKPQKSLKRKRSRRAAAR